MHVGSTNVCWELLKFYTVWLSPNLLSRSLCLSSAMVTAHSQCQCMQGVGTPILPLDWLQCKEKCWFWFLWEVCSGACHDPETAKPACVKCWLCATVLQHLQSCSKRECGIEKGKAMYCTWLSQECVAKTVATPVCSVCMLANWKANTWLSQDCVWKTLL